MRKFLIMLGLGLCHLVHANTTKTLDTIYANEKMTIALFFPSDIKQGITGSEHFVFTYNREKEQNLGLLKAIKGNPSNLLVITKDGKVYSFILKYAERIHNPNRFISIQESIGDSKRRPKEVFQREKSRDTMILDHDAFKSLKRSCESLLKLPEEKNIRTIEGGIVLSVKNMKYQGDHVYLQFEIMNKSSIRFDFGYLTMTKINGNQKRNASYQEIPLNPVYVHNKPNEILPGTTIKMIYVVPKFTVNRNEKLKVKVQELHTTRMVQFIWR